MARKGYHDSTTKDGLRDLWRTPLPIYTWLNSMYHFDVDLSAVDSRLCERFIDPGKDALSGLTSWTLYGRSGFNNPPYSNIEPWFEKAITEASFDFRSVHLVPTPNGEYRYRALEDARCHGITFIHGRLGFLHPHFIQPMAGNLRGSCVIVFGPGARTSPLSVSFIDRDDIFRKWDG
ncbi:MAG: phage N-6-adenine-methyltransferase [candidate division NC10 bacterium CSP1-5]|nr:MAG: phage N-6-adenine-methyltransferase [candidate division NC10 bacterium CSP1-5]KRT69478.1 MAG: phage N-6-adenine-methyltransferase [candidate division NC10 bacterium CSP1-5]